MTVASSSVLGSNEANRGTRFSTNPSHLVGNEFDLPAQTVEAPDKLLRLAAVLKLIGVSRATLYRWCRSGHFVKPCRLSDRLVAWKESEVIHWIKTREVVS